MALLEQILGKIQRAAAEGDLERIGRLNQMAKRVQEIEEGRKAFESELAQIASELNSTATTAPEVQTSSDLESHVGPITVEIDFPRLGVNRPPVVVSERMASNTLRAVVEVLVQAKGSSVLEQLKQLRVNRGPLLTRNPERDFKNLQTGLLYQHQQVGSSGYSILTHSATAEKIRDLGLIAKTLGFSSLHFRVRKNENGEK